jgi:ketosteroid isomerase-like protein
MARKLNPAHPLRFTNQIVVVAMLVAGLALCAPASPARPDAAEKEVLAAENARTTALDHSDVPALEKLLADDLTYVHASGKVDTKATFLEAIRSGELHYISWEARKLNVRVMGDVALLDGEYKVRVTDRRVKPDPFDINIFILSAYAKRGGRWQQVAWQSTRDVALSPPEKP